MIVSTFIGPSIGVISGTVGLILYYHSLLNLGGAITVSLVLTIGLFYLLVKTKVI